MRKVAEQQAEDDVSESEGKKAEAKPLITGTPASALSMNHSRLAGPVVSLRGGDGLPGQVLLPYLNGGPLGFAPLARAAPFGSAAPFAAAAAALLGSRLILPNLIVMGRVEVRIRSSSSA